MLNVWKLNEEYVCQWVDNASRLAVPLTEDAIVFTKLSSAAVSPSVTVTDIGSKQ